MGVWERSTAAKQALRLRPNSVEAYNKLGDAYYYAANFNEAIAAYTQAARLRPDMGEAFYNLGMTYLEIGDPAAGKRMICERLKKQAKKIIDTRCGEEHYQAPLEQLNLDIEMIHPHLYKSI